MAKIRVTYTHYLSVWLCRNVGNGEVEMGVHIADVSHFVSPGSLTDREARQRSTTVYMADRRYDMLPAILSADLCSLLSNVDRWGPILCSDCVGTAPS